MAAGFNTFMTMVVFSPDRYAGTPLAIVAVRGNSIPHQRKALIAREFRCPATVFLHDAVVPVAGAGVGSGVGVAPRRLEVFTGGGVEVGALGEAIIGAAHYIFSWIEKAGTAPDRDAQRQTAVFFLPKVGITIPVFYNNYRQVAACSVPQNLRVHTKVLALDKVLAVQPHTQIVPTIDMVKGRTFPVVSLFKGMAFALIDLTDAKEVFGSLEAGKAPELELDTEDGWGEGFVGCMYFLRKERAEQAGEPTIQNLQCRMISHGSEEAGSGSASCALACYLALQEANGVAEGDLVKKTEDLKLDSNSKEGKMERKVFGIQQGVEMGRLCTIAVEVYVKTGSDGKSHISSVILSGRGNFNLRGELIGS